MASFSPHVALDVPDRASAVDFYRTVLGMTVVEDLPGETILGCGEARFHVQESDEPRVYLEFEVDDIERKRWELEDCDCRLDEVETPEGDTSYVVTDPFGIRYHVFEGSERA